MIPEKDISNFVNSENLKYQCIELPYGIKTPGDSRTEAISLVLNELEKGQTVLDVGSFLGLFCIKSLQHGASEVTGLELNKERLRQATQIADFLQLKPKYLRLDVEGHPKLDKHDLVLCLNVLHHLKNPIGVLRYLALQTNDTLIIEAAQFGMREAAQFGIHDIKSLIKSWSTDLQIAQLSRILLRFIPTVFKSTSSAFIAPYSPKSFLRTFFFSKAALDTILSSHMKLFSSVKIKKSNFKNRYFVICKKLKIKHLVLISGSCGSGKTTFINNMDSNGYSNKLGINKENVTFVSGNMLRDEKLSEPFPRQFNDTVVFHYDINAINRHSIHSYDRDQSLDIMTCAEEISIVLLAPSQDILINQMVSSESKDGSLSSFHSDLQKHYNSLKWLRSLHLDWLDFLRTRKQSLNTYKFYECNSSSNLLQTMPDIDSLEIHIENQYSES
jgi:tRNA A37 threonylcarbamoyladenosine biosynthesis protein TsaE